MTPDQIAAMIPECVVEAAARALADPEFPDCWREWLIEARAAIAAGLAQWPDVASVSSVRKLFPDCLILPLTAKENGE